MTSTPASTGRQAYLDRVRGLAVLIMIEAHVMDGWTRVDDRHSPAFANAIVLGGFGAPLFLFLAGISLVLAAESRLRKTGDSIAAWRNVQKRGWQIFGLAFLFRLQSYVLGGGYNFMGVLKVDILNVMGPAIAGAAFLGSRMKTRGGRALLFAAAASLISLLTPIVRITPLLDALPDPLEWYFRPAPNRTTFTLFPWAAFVFAGAAIGVALDAARDSGRALRTQVILAASSLALIVAAYGASWLPSPYARSDFWTTSPAFFFLRAGIVSLLLPAAFFWERAPWRGWISAWSPLVELGRASLFVYWIHVEMVYGFISRPIRRSLSFQEAIVADLLFSAFLLGLVLLKNRLGTFRRRAAPSAPQVRLTPLSN